MGKLNNDLITTIHCFRFIKVDFKLSGKEVREMTQLLLLRIHQHKGTLSMKKKANNKNQEGTGE